MIALPRTIAPCTPFQGAPGAAFASRYGQIIVISVLFALISGPLQAQEVTLSIGEGGTLATRSVQLLALITVLSVVPGIAIMITCFPFMVTVLSILRQAIGLQQSPPNMMLVSLALFLTYFVMEPVFVAAWDAGIAPVIAETMSIEEGFTRAIEPFRGFMTNRIEADTFEALASLRPDVGPGIAVADAPLSIMVPSFLLSEISRAFQIGFMIFLPFLIIDLIVAAILMSMGMMMVPPAIVSLPFKLAFFVVADGWALVSASLVQSYF